MEPAAEPKVPKEARMAPVGVVTPWPERVVTWMTTLVLPPNSAGGAPSMTSRDWTESEGSWLEKTLLCWSVMGWPSTEKEFSAWSPRPWKRPFESAATPGEERVTSELSEEEALSSGSLSMVERSMSVWKVESVSTRSEPLSTTSTVVELPSRLSLTVEATGTTELTSMVWLEEAKPLSVTVSRYGLKGTLKKRYWPLASVLAMRV